MISRARAPHRTGSSVQSFRKTTALHLRMAGHVRPEKNCVWKLAGFTVLGAQALPRFWNVSQDHNWVAPFQPKSRQDLCHTRPVPDSLFFDNNCLNHCIQDNISPGLFCREAQKLSQCGRSHNESVIASHSQRLPNTQVNTLPNVPLTRLRKVDSV